jgi:hypothetical protein
MFIVSSIMAPIEGGFQANKSRNELCDKISDTKNNIRDGLNWTIDLQLQEEHIVKIVQSESSTPYFPCDRYVKHHVTIQLEIVEIQIHRIILKVKFLGCGLV